MWKYILNLCVLTISISKKQLQSSSAHSRGTVVTAIKYTFTDQAQIYGDLLRPLIVDFLSLIKDQDLVSIAKLLVLLYYNPKKRKE